MQNKYLMLALIVSVALSTSTQAEVVVCTAEKGFHCNLKSGCNTDATYISTYRIDRQGKTLELVSSQHIELDKNPEPHGIVYQIIQSGVSGLTGEKSITAVGPSGTAQVDTILIGERSYVSSSLRDTEPRVFSMFGSCKGFQPNG